MSVAVKICGFREAAALAAAVEFGARYVGFVFCPNTRHSVDPETVSALLTDVPCSVIPVGLFVEPTDEALRQTLRVAKLGMIQLHGLETPERVQEIRTLTKLPVMKAISVATEADLELARQYEAVADMLLFDAKPQGKERGGNGIAFNWSLLSGKKFIKPWMLAGGLNTGNIAQAIKVTRASIVDVSSGVEDVSGHKNPHKIKEFLVLAARN